MAKTPKNAHNWEVTSAGAYKFGSIKMEYDRSSYSERGYAYSFNHFKRAYAETPYKGFVALSIPYVASLITSAVTEGDTELLLAIKTHVDKALKSSVAPKVDISVDEYNVEALRNGWA